jgi:L-ascorbate metabolism protein UlaG (beta-lactamase superfamily)
MLASAAIPLSKKETKMKTALERMTYGVATPGKRKEICIIVASLLMLGCYSAQAQTVKITPLGSRTGEVCAQDRAFLIEDPTGVRILYDPGVPVAGGADARLGDVHVILLTHAHTDHLGANKLNQDPDAATAGCIAADIQTTPAQKSNVAEIAVAKNSAVISGFLLAPFLGGQIRSLRGLSTPPCPATGQANEMIVPRSSPCAGMLNFGGKRTITFSTAKPGVQIALVPAQHENNLNADLLADPLRTNLADNALSAPVGLPAGFVLTFTNGLKVYLSGDTGIIAEMETVIRRLYNVDLAIVNFDAGITKMGPDLAAYAVMKLIKPKGVIPSHMGESATTAGMVNPDTLTSQFIDLVAPMRVHLPRSGVTMEFDRGGDCVVGCSRP